MMQPNQVIKDICFMFSKTLHKNEALTRSSSAARSRRWTEWAAGHRYR